jgi:hypothetical protein
MIMCYLIWMPAQLQLLDPPPLLIFWADSCLLNRFMDSSLDAGHVEGSTLCTV